MEGGRGASGSNTIDFVRRVMADLGRAGVATRLCGGWAEELYGWFEPRAHGDVDLVHAAADFAALDAHLSTAEGAAEILGKRLRHKRAFEIDGVMVEVVLVARDARGRFTDSFGVSRQDWPADLLAGRAEPVPMVSEGALRAARSGWSRHPAYSSLRLERDAAGVLVPLP